MTNLPAIIDTEAFQTLEKVADLMMQGKSEYQIGRALSMKAVEARVYMQQWQQLINDDMASKDAARDHLNRMVVRYEGLIEQASENLDNLKAMVFDEKVSAQINATLKNIADFDAKRVDALQRAGLLDAHDLGDELAEREQREELLLGILRNDLCDDCRMVVARKLQEVTNVVEATVVYNDDE